MAATAYARQTYEEMQVLSADPRRLVVMLFEAAHRFLLQARDAMEARSYEQQANAIIRAQRIYVELICGLDEEIGGELARSLKTLYNHIHELLRVACIHEDAGKLDEAIALTAKLCATWKEAEVRCQEP